MSTKYVYIESDNEYGNMEFKYSKINLKSIILSFSRSEHDTIFFKDGKLLDNDSEFLSDHDFYAKLRYFSADLSEEQFYEIIEEFSDYDDSKHSGYYYVGIVKPGELWRNI